MECKWCKVVLSHLEEPFTMTIKVEGLDLERRWVRKRLEIKLCQECMETVVELLARGGANEARRDCE